ncbi:PepSY domain-containing protein [Nocardioides solisilvae]|uniref:PepSY domain-containing protein n=1 Tax=Nocardioides solisilvae TaxID=1542435 RepID=UPI000D74C719|nr:PepSY domain-containing protein [Nocardioides solisilvae]
MPSAKTRVLVPAVAVVALLGAGGVAWAATSGDDRLGGDERDRVSAAALEAVGGGTVTDVETSDDRGVAYEVEVRAEDGSEVDVDLDDDLGVVRQETDDSDDSDDRVLTDAERADAERAALAAVGGGTVTDVEASDDRGVAYEVEVRAEDGSEVDVDLDDSFEVVSKETDR